MNQRHSLELEVLQFARQKRLIVPGEPLLAGVSGGPDSVALLHILVTLRDDLQIRQVMVAHFDHGLRGAESAGDRLFVEQLASELGLACRCGTENVEEVARNGHLSMEMAARICRHRFFQEMMKSRAVQRIGLAHTANDQAEETLLRLCRGAGPSGLSGMHPREVSGIVRPLLFATKNQILAYLSDRRLPYRLDSTNEAPICQRNRLRLEVLPLLEDILHPGVISCMARHAQLVQDEDDLWSRTLEELWPTVCAADNGDEIRLRHNELAQLHPALLRRLFRHSLLKLRHHLLGIYSLHIESLCDLVARPSRGRQVHLPGMLRGEVDGAHVVLTKGGLHTQAGSPPAEPCWISRPGIWRWGETTLHIEIMDRRQFACTEGAFTGSRTRVWMDAQQLLWPLCLRSRLPGDRFQPLGLGKSKKLQDFFVDLKIPRAVRDRVPLLCDREKICWVVGHRLDDRVKIHHDTGSVLTVELIQDSSPE